MGVTALDGLLIVLFISICSWAVIQGVLRQTMSLAVLYLATVVAGLLYPLAARYVTAIGGRTPTLTQTVMFWVLFLATTIALEVLLRRGFPDVRLVRLSLLDNLLGLAPGIVCAFIVTALVVTSLGYAPGQTWGPGLAFLRTASAYAYKHAMLRPLMSQFLALYLAAHRLWMPVPPPLLAYPFS